MICFKFKFKLIILSSFIICVVGVSIVLIINSKIVIVFGKFFVLLKKWIIFKFWIYIINDNISWKFKRMFWNIFGWFVNNKYMIIIMYIYNKILFICYVKSGLNIGVVILNFCKIGNVMIKLIKMIKNVMIMMKFGNWMVVCLNFFFNIWVIFVLVLFIVIVLCNVCLKGFIMFVDGGIFLNVCSNIKVINEIKFIVIVVMYNIFFLDVFFLSNWLIIKFVIKINMMVFKMKVLFKIVVIIIVISVLILKDCIDLFYKMIFGMVVNNVNISFKLGIRYKVKVININVIVVIIVVLGCIFENI